MKDGANIFEIILLFVGIGVAVLGFHLINQAYSNNSQVSWLMIISIFNWLTLIVLFILLSLMVDTSKKELKEMKDVRSMIVLLSNKKKGR